MSAQDLGQYIPAVRQNGVRLNANEPLVAAGQTQLATGAQVGTIGIYSGAGVPSLSAPKGSLYSNTTASTVSTRLYVNTDGGTTWTAVTTAA
jgi:hypothetical protein